jgi:hypothetical protein
LAPLNCSGYLELARRDKSARDFLCYQSREFCRVFQH